MSPDELRKLLDEIAAGARTSLCGLDLEVNGVAYRLSGDREFDLVWAALRGRKW